MVEEFFDLGRYDYLLKIIDEWEGGQAEKLGEWLINNLKPKSVIDIGCASGLYLLPFSRHGITVLGIDGAPESGGKLSPSEFMRHDLRRGFVPTQKYDLCLCLETAEHIEPAFVDVFVKTVAGCSDTIVFSAAAPGQGGEGHWNLQERKYWMDKFAAYGFGLHDLNDAMMAVIQANVDSFFHPWLINNGMLLGR